jgi:hypothetical protein
MPIRVIWDRKCCTQRRHVKDHVQILTDPASTGLPPEQRITRRVHVDSNS